jgi:SAM-dependent methyltransferase
MNDRLARPNPQVGGFEAGYFADLAALEAKNFWFRARNRIIAWALTKYFPHARSFFEIGCGTGFVLSGLAQEAPGIALYGSELFAEGLAFAARRVPAANLVQMDARHIALANSVDVIGAFDVLEHIAEDQQVLLEMFNAVRPGGGIIVTVPQHKFLWSRQDDYAHHVRRYAAAELRDKLAAAGFNLVRMSSFVSLLLPLMFLSRWKKERSSEFDPLDELRIGRVTNALLQKVLEFELAMIRAGVDWPAGGSLLAVATK